MHYKFQTQKDLFGGTIERGVPPKPSSIDEILHQVKDMKNLVLTRAPFQDISREEGNNWNKKSIFFELPY